MTCRDMDPYLGSTWTINSSAPCAAFCHIWPVTFSPLSRFGPHDGGGLVYVCSTRAPSLTRAGSGVLRVIRACVPLAAISGSPCEYSAIKSRPRPYWCSLKASHAPSLEVPSRQHTHDAGAEHVGDFQSPPDTNARPTTNSSTAWLKMRAVSSGAL